MFSRFFINRPIFASVLSIVITLAGGIAVFTLPVTQYPEITPPTVEVFATYPGANAEVVMNTVAAPIEQQVNGVESMMYMSSTCTNDGNYTLTVTFKVGTDLNIAQVLVQNRVTLAQPVLPDLVKRLGVLVRKKSPTVLMIVNLFSPNGSRDDLYLSNYATIHLRDELARLPGVGDITYLGKRDYSMRVWLDPGKLWARRLSSADVVRAIEQQNIQVAAGQIGQPPVPSGQVNQYTMTTRGRLSNPEEFADIILKSEAGRIVRLRDVANVELGAQGYDQACTLDRKPSVALSIYQLPGSNALEVARLVRGKMEELRRQGQFPSGVDFAIVYDTTPVIQESIIEVFNTLRDAVLLVAFVVLLFLQNWRSAVIPLVAVPVAVVGTFAIMTLMGFSLNNLTLFGLVLAIGIVVDDAIVVVEAVEHHIEQGMAPREATLQAMREVSGPVVAIGLVLSAVFIPCAFIAGIVGLFFRQFALTIAVSTLISAFNSLTLSPALCALLLRPRGGAGHEVLPRHGLAALLGLGATWLLTPRLEPWLDPLQARLAEWWGEAVYYWALRAAVFVAAYLVGFIFSRPLNWSLSVSFRSFNAGFGVATSAYTRAVGGLLRVSLLVLVVYGGLLVLTWWSFTSTPTGFIPAQDKGYLLVNVQLPDASSVGRTQETIARLEEAALRTPGVSHTVAISGQSLLLGANSPNYGAMYVMLEDFHDRAARGLSADVLAGQLQEEMQRVAPEGVINLFGAPPVEGLGTAGGFKIMIEDRGDNGPDALQQFSESVRDRAADNRRLQGLFTSFRANTPWVNLDIDRTQAKTMGVSLSEVFGTLQAQFGSLYVNDFNRFSRTWQVNIQAAGRFRRRAEDLKYLEFRNDQGQMVPLQSFARFSTVNGPVMLVRYNMYPAAPVNGSPGPGTSSGQAIDLMEQTVRAEEEQAQLMRYEWTELALLQLQTGNTAMRVFLLAVVLVFLVLAAQYESWSLPLAVILVVPMCLLCSVAGVQVARMDINIFTQVGFIVLVGLACKNAILIVEFAKARREAGVSRRQATLEACRLRLRPIMMTSFAFIFGVIPLVIAVGAGAEMRRTLGTAVFSGMLGVTLFGIFLTPVFYYVIQWISDRRQAGPANGEPLVVAGPVQRPIVATAVQAASHSRE